MNLREKQDEFIELMSALGTWTDRFDYFIELSDSLTKECPADMNSHKIGICLSNTFFKATNDSGKFKVEGWSNSSVMGGIIVAIMDIFNGIPIDSLKNNSIDFHTKTGLIDNITPMRQSAVMTMINRISVLYSGNILSEI